MEELLHDSSTNLHIGQVRCSNFLRQPITAISNIIHSGV